MKIIKKIYRWCTRTRLRKILSSILAILILLTSIKYIFIPPSSVKATDVFIKLDEGYGTAPADTNSVIPAGTITNATWQKEELCKVGKCLYFDGTGDFVTYGDSASLDMAAADTVTVEAWFRTAAISSGTRTLISKNNTTTGADGGYKITMNSSGQISFGISSTTTFPAFSATTTSRYDDNQWHFVSAVKNGTSTISIYIDASAPVTTNITSTDASNGDSFIIGRDTNNTSNDWLGFVDEVKILRTARTQAQIQTDMTQETGSQGAAATFAPNQSYISNGLVGYWKLDEAAWGTPNCSTSVSFDSSGNSNNLRACPNSTGPTGGSLGKFGNGVALSSQYMEIDAPSSTLNLTGPMTISLWIKSTGAQTDYSRFVDKDYTTGYAFGIGGGSGRDLAFTLSNNVVIDTAEVLTDNVWQQVTVTYDGKDAVMYLNGVSVGSGAFAGPITGNSTNIGIGASHTGSWPFSGSLDDIRIYNRGLSASEVQSLYNWAPGPIGEWKLDDNTGTTTAVDTSGNGNPGTITNTGSTVWVPGKFGSALNSDITANTKVDAGAPAIFNNLGALTADIWIYPRTAGDNNEGRFFDKTASTGPNTGWYFKFTNSTRTMQFKIDCGTAGGPDVNDLVYETTNVIPLNTWSHVALTWDGNVDPTNHVHIYINGVEASYTNAQSCGGTGRVAETASSNMKLGNSTGSNRTFDGYLDNAKLYNYPRTTGQIIEDMNAGHPAPGSPIGSSMGHWRFDEGYGDTAYDSSLQGNTGNLAGTSAACPTGADDACPTWTNAGKFGKALTFSKTGVDDYVEIPDSASLRPGNESWTASLWAKLPDSNQSGALISKNLTTGNLTQWSMFTCDSITCTGSGQLLTAFFRESSTVYRYAVSTADIADNTWHNYVMVADKTADTIYLYMDGNKLATTTASSGAWPTINNTDALRIGGQNSAGNNVDAAIDEVNVFNFALSSDQIKVLYNQASSAAMGAVSTDSSGNASFASDRSYCPPGNTDTNCGSGDPSPVGEWKLDENTGSTTSDTSTNDNTGTFTGGVTWAPGKMGSAAKINGVNGSYITMGDPADGSLDVGTGNFSIEAWVNLDPTSAVAIPSIAEKGATSGAVAGYWLYYLNSNSQVQFRVGDGTNRTGPSVTTTIKDGLWHHIAAVADRTGTNFAYLYIDGRQVASADISTVTGSADNALIFTLSSDQGGCAWFGSLDNAALYKYVRSPAQIAWDYNYGKPVAWWKMDEASWNGTAGEVKDSSGNSLNGTAAGNATTTTSGKYNNAGTFDGTGDYFDASDNNILDITGDFTLSAWVNLDTASVGNQFIITKRSGGGGGGGYDIAMGNTQEIFCQTDNGSTTTSSSTPAGTISTSAGWQHIAAVRSGTSCKIYIDGVDRTSSAATHTTLTANANAVRVGGNLNSSEYWHGQIDDARIYNYALTPQQVKTVMNDASAIRYGP